MNFVQAVFLRLKMRKVDVIEEDLSPIEYDMKGINNRVYRAMSRTGRTRTEIAELFGMDSSIPLAMQPLEKIPRPTMGNVVRIAALLGVSVRWVLYGEPECDVDFFVESAPTQVQGAAALAIQGSAVVNGNERSTIIVKNIQGEPLSDQEREVLLAFRRLSVRDQAAIMSFVFELENQTFSK